MSEYTLVRDAYLALKKEIPNIEDYLVCDIDDVLALEYNEFKLDMSTDRHCFIIRVRQREHAASDGWCRRYYSDETKFTLSITGMRDTNYSSPSRSFVKRVREIIKRRESKIELEKQMREKAQEEADLIQAKIDKINSEFSNCIKIHRTDEYDVGFPILEIGSRKYNICLEQELVNLNGFNDIQGWNKPDNKTPFSFPLHLAIPFLQEVEMFKLLES